MAISIAEITLYCYAKKEHVRSAYNTIYEYEFLLNIDRTKYLFEADCYTGLSYRPFVLREEKEEKLEKCFEELQQNFPNMEVWIENNHIRDRNALLDYHYQIYISPTRDEVEDNPEENIDVTRSPKETKSPLPVGNPRPTTKPTNVNKGPIQEAGTDWIKQNDVYRREMYVSYLPNDLAPYCIYKLSFAEGVSDYSMTINRNRSTEQGSDQTSLLSSAMSNIFQILEKSKIYKKARSRILSNLADETTEKVNEPAATVSVVFEITSNSKQELDSHTENLVQEASQFGVGVAPAEGPPKALAQKNYAHLKNEYCVTVEAAAYSEIQSALAPPIIY